MTRRARAVLAVACGAHFIHDGFSDLLYVLLPVWASEFGLSFAQVGLLKTLYMIEFIKTMIRESKSSTLREMYYISEGWELGKFETQDESNSVAEDLEIVAKAMREDFKLRPEENGASVIGNITIVERNRKGELKTINCRDDVGDSGYALPFNVEKEKIQIKDFDAKFICAIETGGMFDRLVENGFDEKYDAVLVHLKGQPARSTRRFIKRLNEECKLPVVCFRRRPVVVPHLRVRRLRRDQDGAHLGVPGDPDGAVPRSHALGHRELRPAFGQAERPGCQGAQGGAHGPALQGLLLARRD